MLDQMQVTTLPIDVSVPSLPSFSYVIGPIDPTQIITMHAQLSTGDECSLLLPVHLPRHILDDPAFRDGYEYNYLSEEEENGEQEEWMSSVPRVVNHIYASLTDARFYRDLLTGEVVEDFLPWELGWLLRDLTRVAETDRTLAYVGIGHLCFLLPLLTQHRPVDWPRTEPYHPVYQHDRAVKAYRARVRFYRGLGTSYDEAQRLALVENVE